MYYLGQASSWQLCEALCGGWESCVSFDWHSSGEGAFTHTCYARTTDYFQPKRASGRVVGMRPGSVPGTAPACVIPPAPPGPPAPPPQPPSDIDCAFRSLGEKNMQRPLASASLQNYKSCMYATSAAHPKEIPFGFGLLNLLHMCNLSGLHGVD